MKMIRLFFDTETLRWSDEVDGGWDNIANFGLAVGVFQREIDSPRLFSEAVFTPDRNVQDTVWSLGSASVQRLIDEADRVVTFNGEGFDFKVLESAGFDMSNCREKSFDILARFYSAAGHRISLDSLACEVIGRGKVLDGRSAVSYWQSALTLWGMSRMYVDRAFADYHKRGAEHLFRSVVDYCRDDVSLTRQLYHEIMRSSGEIALSDKTVTIDIT